MKDPERYLEILTFDGHEVGRLTHDEYEAEHPEAGVDFHFQIEEGGGVAVTVFDSGIPWPNALEADPYLDSFEADDLEAAVREAFEYRRDPE